MRILIAGDIRAVHLMRYVRYFKSNDHEVKTVSLEESPEYKADFPLHMARLPSFLKYPAVRGNFRRVIDVFKPDLINCHFLPNYGFLGALSKFHPLAVNVWGSDLLISADHSWFHRKRVRYVLKKSDLIVTDAAMLTERVNQYFKRNKKVTTAPFGIDRDLLERGRKRIFGTGKAPVLISTRQHEQLYQVSDLLEAVAHLPDKIIGGTIIVGSGSLKENLREAARELELTDVSFTGRVAHSEVFDQLDQADIYVSCSNSDSTSVSLLEAMASGLFPVVSDIEGNREWIRHGQNGLLFDVSDIDALSKMIIWAAENPSLRERARKYNFDLIEKKAVWENNMTLVEEEFSRLVAKQ